MFRFPWGDMHSLNLGWFLQKFNELREDWATAEAGIGGALDAEIQRAEDALSDVFDARDAAAASASAANSSALNASQSSIASMDARDQSRAARDTAQQAARNAAASETAAGNSATAASNSAGAAATSATQAGNSATAASNSATAAGQEATNAAGSATAAAGSASDAADSATAAAASAAHAEEVEQSIPADYSTLSADVATLKNNDAEKYVTNSTSVQLTGNRCGITAASFAAAKATKIELMLDIPAGTYGFPTITVETSGFTASGTTKYEIAPLPALNACDFKNDGIIIIATFELIGRCVKQDIVIRSKTQREKIVSYQTFSLFNEACKYLRSATIWHFAQTETNAALYWKTDAPGTYNFGQA